MEIGNTLSYIEQTLGQDCSGTVFISYCHIVVFTIGDPTDPLLWSVGPTLGDPLMGPTVGDPQAVGPAEVGSLVLWRQMRIRPSLPF